MTELGSLVERWVSAGLISQEQGRQILAEEKQPVLVATPRGSIIAEALAYVGGVLLLLAVIIIANIYWPSLTLPARSGLTGAAAVALLAAGFLLPQSMGRARVRLRAVMWALAVATFGFFVGVIFHGLKWNSEDGVLIAAACATGLAIALWLLQKTFLQQAALGLAVALTVIMAAAHLPNENEAIGLALWGTGLAWLALAWGELLNPQRTGYLLGAAAVVAGAELTTPANWGLALASVTVVVLVIAASVLVRDLWLLGVGSVGVLITTPIIIDRFFEGDLAAPLALLGAGVLLIGLGVLTARQAGQRTRQRPAQSPKLATIEPWLAVILAAAIAVAVTLVVLVVGR